MFATEEAEPISKKKKRMADMKTRKKAAWNTTLPVLGSIEKARYPSVLLDFC